MSAAAPIPIHERPNLTLEVYSLRRQINAEQSAREALGNAMERATQRLEQIARAADVAWQPGSAMKALAYLYAARPCWICNQTGACGHREPSVDWAEIIAAAERMEP